jgi:hypothetical protein
VDETSVKVPLSAVPHSSSEALLKDDDSVNGKFAGAEKLSEVNVEDYDAIFCVGYGPVNIRLAFQM